MLTNFECSLRPTRKNPCLTHRQDAQSWQRYEHISSSTRSRATGYNTRLIRSWVTLVLTTPYEGRRHQLSWCYRETDVAYGHDEIREPICRCQITHIATCTRKHSDSSWYLICSRCSGVSLSFSFISFIDIIWLFEDRNQASMESHLDDYLCEHCSADDEIVFQSVTSKYINLNIALLVQQITEKSCTLW